MGTPLRVLIVEDSEDDALLLVRELKRGGYEPISERVETAESMKAALEKQKWDIIIADYVMPHFSGLNALKLLQKGGLDIPFIIVSGSIGEETAVAAMKAGANDYLMKNKLARLVPAIEQEVREAEVRRKLEHSEKALQESEKRYRQVVENATDIIYTVDEKGNFTYANPAGLRVTGYLLGELRKLNFADLVLPEHRERVSQIYINQFRERLPTTYVEFPFIGKAGEILWFGQNSTLVMEGDKIVGLHIIARDITERKRAEEVIKGLAKFPSENPSPVLRIERDGTLLYANEASYSILRNWQLELGRPAPLILQKVAFEALTQQIGKTIDTEHDQRTISFSVAPIVSAGYANFYGLDITERKKMEEALRKGEEKYRTILENIEEGYYEVDLAGNFTFLNDSMSGIFGYPKVELMGMNDRQYTDKENAKRLFQAFNEAYRTGEPHIGYGYEIIGKDGTKRYIEASILLQKDSLDKPIGFRGIIRDITERRRAEETLRESEQRYRNLVENAPDVIYTLTPDGKIASLNPAFERITGWLQSEWLHKQFVPMLHPDDLSQGLELFQRILKGEKIAPFVLRVLRKSGDYLVAEFMVTPQIQNESVIGILGIARDVTEHKKAEEALKKSEERFKELYDDAPIGYFEYNTDGCITSVNRTELEMLGYSVEEMIGQPPWKFVVEEDIARQRILDVLAGIMPPARGLERTFRRKDGTTFPALIQDRLFQDAEGKILGIRGTIQDITDRKRIEVSLRKSEQTYRTLVESSTDAILMLDTERNIVACNQSFLNLFGYERGEVVGGSIRVVHPSDESFRSFGKTVYSMIERSGFFKGEWEFKRKDNVIFSAETVTSAIKSAEGSTTGYIAILRDLTDRKRAEEEKVALVDQLRQSQKMEAIGRLAGGVAHDFNNLLTVIKGYCQLSLVEMKEGNPLREAFEVINKATEKAANLTRQLLAFSRRQIMEMKVLDLNDLFRNLDKMLRRVIGEDIELVTILDENLGRVKTDTGQIEQVIMNLVVNARDAMPKGGKLTIETANVDLDGAYARAHVAVKPGPYVMLAVSDTGVGMTPEVKERVFEPFFTTKDKGKGTGLGLSTVYGIVKQSGGNIWVYSEPGKGTIFKIYLPRVDEPLEESKGEVKEEELAQGSETILIVEDNEDVRKLAARVLEKQGYTVWVASQGSDALSLCGEYKKPIHMVLCDVVMPGIGGRELTDHLISLHPEMKVLYMSGYTENAIVHHGILIEGMNYIQKPFTVNGLTRKVREVLNQSRQH